MVVFLTSIRHPENAKDYGQIEKILKVTLGTVCGQTSDNFKVVVVCNQVPENKYDDPRIEYHVVDFPPPAVGQNTSSLQFSANSGDKACKLYSGLLYSKKYSPDYVYIFDADDWIHKDIVKTLEESPKAKVWYVDKGYFVSYSEKEYKKKAGLTRYCGSTFAYDYEFILEQGESSKHPQLTENSSKEDLLNTLDEHYIYEILGNHAKHYNYFKSMGITPQSFKFRAACWVLGTGENWSGESGKANGLPCDEQFCSDFNLPRNEFLNTQKPDFIMILKDLIGSFISEFKWFMSRVQKRNYF
ncbi:hypothetical protein BTA51_10400 [Hahella sp. CCB-MM4]|uniref:glycosyltransferase family A protein n=1 Tax=Hahella sp. (strain CCB-MM4) TaxID=1926491 RepID=UPI000B9B9DC9|nr:glycosyltransferase family A protein [Hahella sp. CCB-MM4]OZG73427.1 hypothetical protein BTA51_10400 [Hahella sp. CCB-MM4]